MSSSGGGYLDHGDWPEQRLDTLSASSAAFADSTAVTTTSKGSQKSPLSKTIRRRSRASKKTPTTILNANENNFMSLVQQFTGRPKWSSTDFPLGPHRGPVILNFSNYREQDYPIAAQYSDSHDGLTSGSLTSSYAFPDQTPTQLHLQKNRYGQGLGSGMSSFNSYSTETNFDGGLVSGLGGSSVAPQEELDEFPVEDLLDLARVSEGFSYDDYW